MPPAAASRAYPNPSILLVQHPIEPAPANEAAMRTQASVLILMACLSASPAQAQTVSTGTLSLDSLLSIPISAASRLRAERARGARVDHCSHQGGPGAGGLPHHRRGAGNGPGLLHEPRIGTSRPSVPAAFGRPQRLQQPDPAPPGPASAATISTTAKRRSGRPTCSRWTSWTASRSCEGLDLPCTEARPCSRSST